MSFGRDVWLKPITLTSANNKFRINESGGGECILSIKPGSYFLHNDENYDADENVYPGLYRAIADVLNTGASSDFYESHTGTLPSNVNYNFEAYDPSISPFIERSGLRLGGSWIGGGSPPVIYFQVDFSDVDFTMAPSWFGFVSGNTLSDNDGGGQWIQSVISIFGRWYSMSLYNGEASRKHPIPFANVEYSSKRPGDSVAIPWEIGLYRRFVYPFVQAAHIFDRRALDQTFAESAGIAHGDINNAFESNIWESLVQSEKVICLHDTGWANLYFNGSFEVVKLAQPWPELSPQLSPYRGEFYTLDFRVWVNPDVGGYEF